ncbi:MAG TPA: hypothetical protein VNA15_05415 [Candidatus Angelobacter sp.]|nr:hypothetical protein [Candidatus Angelobacter sp.]
MSYGGGTLSLLLRFFLRRRSAKRCPICGIDAGEFIAGARRMSPSIIVSHYKAQHKEYYDWLVRWTIELLLLYGGLLAGLLFFIFSLGVQVFPFLVLVYVLSGFILHRFNSIRHEKTFASNWVKPQGSQ